MSKVQNGSNKMSIFDYLQRCTIVGWVLMRHLVGGWKPMQNPSEKYMKISWDDYYSILFPISGKTKIWCWKPPTSHYCVFFSRVGDSGAIHVVRQCYAPPFPGGAADEKHEGIPEAVEVDLAKWRRVAAREVAKAREGLVGAMLAKQLQHAFWSPKSGTMNAFIN